MTTKSTMQEGKDIISDSTITTKIKTKYLMDITLNSLNIHVDTKEGIVTLAGTLPNKESLDHAIEIAEKIEGVKKVVSKLDVSGA